MLRIVGDVNLTDGAFDVGIGIGTKLRQGLNPFKGIERKPKDKWIGNFEGVVSSVSCKTGAASQMFRMDHESLKCLHHLNYYGVANNHVMEHGSDAFNETLSSIVCFGSDHFGSIGKKSLIFEHQGKEVSLTAFSLRPDNFTDKPLYWSLPENIELGEELISLKEIGANFHIAFIHGGIEFINYPYNDEKSFYRSIIDMGYDMVIGMHPHVLQGYELWHGKYIFYSIGNFLFNMPWYKTKYGAIVNVDLSHTKPLVSYEYIKISDDLQPYIVVESDVPEDCRFDYLNKLLTISEENEKYFARAKEELGIYRKVNRGWIINNFTKMPKNIVKEMIMDFFRRKLKR